MSYAVWLVPVGLVMGLVGLLAFLWSMKSGQLEDLDGAAERVLLAEAGDRPLPAGSEEPRRRPHDAGGTEDAGAPLHNGGKEGADLGAHR